MYVYVNKELELKKNLNLNQIWAFFDCSHNLLWRPDPAACTREPAKLETLLASVASEHAPWLRLPAPPKMIFFVVTIMLCLRSEVFTGPAVIPVALSWLSCGCQDCHLSLLTRVMCSTTDAKNFVLLRWTDCKCTTPTVCRKMPPMLLQPRSLQAIWLTVVRNVLVWWDSSQRNFVWVPEYVHTPVSHAYHMTLRDSRYPSTWSNCWISY